MAIYDFSPDDLKDPLLVEQERRWAAGEPIAGIRDMMSAEEMSKPENAAWGILDVLQRGEYLSANTVRWMMGTEDADPFGALLGTRKTTYFDVADDLGLDGATRFLFAIGAGVGLDPTTYTGFGSVSKLGKLSKIIEGQTKRAVELAAIAKGENYFGALRRLGKEGFEAEAKKVAQNIARSKNALGREVEFAMNNGLDIYKFGTTLEQQVQKKQRFVLSFMGQDILPDFLEKPLARWGDNTAYWMNTGAVPKWFKGIFDTDVFVTPTSPGMSREQAIEMSGMVNEARRKSTDRGRAFAMSAVEGVQPFYKLFQKIGMKEHDQVAELLETSITKGGGAALKKYLTGTLGFTAKESDEFWVHGREALDKLYEMEQAAGVATGKAIGLSAVDADKFASSGIMDEAIDDVAYVPHMLTDYGKKVFFGDAGPGAPKDMAKWIGSHVSNKDRMFVDATSGRPWTLRQIQTMAEKEGLWIGDKFYKPGEIKEKLFSTDLPQVYAVRYLRAARAMVAKQYMDDLAEAVGAIAPPNPTAAVKNTIPFGWVQPQNNPYWKATRYGDGEYHKWYVPKEIAKLVDETFTQLTNADELNKGLEWLDAATGIWKASTLAAFPAYHARNLVGNAWQYMMAGAHKDPASFQEGLMLSLEAKHYGRYNNPFDTVRLGSDKLAKDWVLTTPTEQIGKDALWAEMKDRGVIGGIYVSENERRIQKSLATSKTNWQKANPLSQDFLVYQKGFEIGQKYIEDPFRIGAYLHFRKQGLSPDAAGLEVKKYFYDYFDLTKVERQLLKRVLPFYAWTRKNIPRQFQQIFEKPGHMALIPKMRNANDEREAIDGNPAFWPEWIKAGMPLQIRKNPVTGEHEYMLLNGYLPPADLAHLVDPGGLFFDMLNPLLKEPYQQLRNFDSRYEREIARFPGEITEFASAPVPTRVSHALRNIRALTIADRIFTKNELSLGKRAGREVVTQFLGGRLVPLDLEKEKVGRLLDASKELSKTRREITRQSKAYKAGRKTGASMTNIRKLLLQEAEQRRYIAELEREPVELGR